ncbi:SPOR domain-containing protein, partial [Rhodobacteraceae bacterium]|nr:SPOR domain-containing protein [Paracoccaceae bacterium]
MGVSGCGPTGMGGAGSGTPVATSVEVVERDVEAPDVFDVSEAGLWDGRPSL